MLAAAAIVGAAGLAFAAPQPQYHLPLDGDGKWGGTSGASAKAAVVHGAAKWVDGVSGKALNVTRHAYDQVTALVADSLPGVSTRRGTLAFWFKPNWDLQDGEHHVIIGGRTANWRPFRFYMTKGKNGGIEFSLVEAKQVQFLRKDFFKKDTWTHVAVSWNADDSSVCLFKDGKLVERKEKAGAFAIADESVELVLQCGEGTDRFKANVGNGLYDDIKIFDVALAEQDVFMIATGDANVPMHKVQLPATGPVFLSHAQASLPSAAPIMRFTTSGGAKFTLSAMGMSRTLTLSGATDGASAVVSGADTLDLRAGYSLSFIPRGKTLVFGLDGAEQGRVELDRDVGKIVSAEVADGVTVGQPRPRKGAEPAPATAGEAALWSLGDAARKVDGVRKSVSLNGFWRVWPVNDYLGAPPDMKPGYMRVPGSFRSPLWNIHSLDPASGALDHGVQKWNDKSTLGYRAAWYERELKLPAAKKGGRFWIVFDHFNVDTGRIYWNGKLVKAVRNDFKSFTMVPNRVRIDVTDRLSEDGRNTLRLYVDRHFTGLWKGMPSLADHGEICLGDVWLERTPDRLHVVSGVALPSWRGKSAALRVRVANPARAKDRVELVAAFARPDGVKTFRRAVALNGEREQVVSWTEPWPDPVPWSAESPETYDLEFSVVRGGEVVDTFPRQRFGFREAWVDKGELWLNGTHLRLRMWTSPSLERLRYYYGDPESVDQYVAHVKALNYDTIRDNPWRKSSLVGHLEYLDACDRLGVYVLHQMPTYEDEPRGEYAAEVERFFEAYATHPSILMWYTDFNTCGYSWGQDPAKLTDVKYDPPSKALPRRRARTAEETMRALDASRECFQHAGANMGKIFTSMNYQSYGTPLQEQEDWPAQWAKGHVQPLMVVESGYPYPGQFERFDGAGAKEHLGAEQAARYFGPSTFAAERFPVPHSAGSLHWYVDQATGEDPNMSRLSDLHYRRVVRAWRGYDLSALGDFPGGRDHTHTAQMFGAHRVVWRVGGDPKTPGLKPEVPDGGTEVQRHLLMDYSRPDYLHGTIRECFAPLLAFVAGDPDDFTNKDHSFYAGERFRKSLVLVNDHLYPVTVSYAWKCGAATGSGKAEVPAGGIVREPIALVAPDVAEKTSAQLTVAWRWTDAKGEETKSKGSLALRFFPRRAASAAKPPRRVALYDPRGKTAAVLKAAGIAYERVDSPAGAAPGDLLVVGQGAFASAPLEGALPASVGDAIVFEQPTNSLKRFVMSAPSCRDSFANVAKSPYLAGLDDEDLADWRGSSDTVPAFVLSDESSPHYPRSKWKCGNGGIVSGCAIRRPSRGGFKTIVTCGFNLENAALLEERRAGGGRVLWCQLDMTSRYGKDPAATRLVDNLFAELLPPRAPAARQRVRYLGGANDAQTLALLGAKVPEWEGKPGGTVLVLPGADLSRLPFKYARGRTLDFRAAVPDDPAFSGVAAADCYFRNANDLPSPAFDVRREGGTTFVFLGVAPDGSVKGLWNDEKIARTWSAVLGNVGATLAPETPYLPKLDLYDGDAFHNW